MSFKPPAVFAASSFSIFQRALMQKDGLPLADVIDSGLFADAFERHGVAFGDDEDAVYTPAITLWALVSQVFFAMSLHFRDLLSGCSRHRQRLMRLSMRVRDFCVSGVSGRQDRNSCSSISRAILLRRSL